VPSTALQIGNASTGTVSRMPQTNAKPVGGAPFVRMSRKAQVQGWGIAGVAFGTLVNPPLKAAGGYLSRLILTVTTGTVANGNLTAVTASADAPWNCIQSLFLRDPLGQPIVQTDGYGLYLINKYSGLVGEGVKSDPSALPSFSAVSASGTAGLAGLFTFKLSIPLQLDSAAYCALSSLNAAAQPTINIQLNPSTVVYTSVTGTTVPTLNITCEQEFWAVPIQDSSLAPPDVGSSSQFSFAPGAQSIASGAAVRVTAPRVGTWIHTLITVMRDNTNARVDNFPLTDLTMWVDGVPVVFELFADRVDKMSVMTDGITRDTGVIAYTFRDAVKQIISLADTHDVLLPTTPATLFEIGGTFQTVGNSPATLQFYTGELYPVNAARVPYTHLSM
jgi:hypothetical protein